MLIYIVFFPQTIRDWNDLPDSSMSDDCVSKGFTSLDVSPVNYSDSAEIPLRHIFSLAGVPYYC